MEVIKIVINSNLPKMNEEINEVKKHWALYAEHKKNFTDIVHWECKSQYRGKTIDKPCSFIFLWYIHGHDPDNVYFGQKYIFDGMVSAKVLTDDKYKNTRGGVLHYPIKIKKSEKCKVVVFVLPHFSFFSFIKSIISKFL